jgi:hypothetical protein
MADDDIVILCDPANLGGKSKLNRYERSSTGRVQYSVTIESEPLVHDFDPKSLGAPVAVAMADSLRKKVLAISETASLNTLKARRSAERGLTNAADFKEMQRGAFAKKEIAAGRGDLLKAGPSGAWVMKRYGGGKLGFMPPNQTNRKFNDSGRMAKSIVAQPSDEAWHINIAANRLDPTTTSGELGVQRIWRQLVRLVPAFEKPMTMFNERELQDAMRVSLQSLIAKAELTRNELTKARAKAKMAALKQVLGIARSILQAVA